MLDSEKRKHYIKNYSILSQDMRKKLVRNVIFAFRLEKNSTFNIKVVLILTFNPTAVDIGQSLLRVYSQHNLV